MGHMQTRIRSVCCCTRRRQQQPLTSISQWAIDTFIALLVVPHGLTDAWAIPVIPMGICYSLSAIVVGCLCRNGGFHSWVRWQGRAFRYGSWLLSVIIPVPACRMPCATARPSCILFAGGVHAADSSAAALHKVIPATPMAGWLALAAFAAGSWSRPLVLLRASSFCRRVCDVIVAHTIANTFHEQSELKLCLQPVES